MNLKEAVRGLAILRALEGIVKAEIEEGKAVVTTLFEEAGAKSAEARLADGTPIATVTMTEKDGTIGVDDKAAYDKWLLEKYPDAWVEAHDETIHVAAHFRPEVYKGAANLLKKQKDGTYVDPDTGEVVAGLRYMPGSTYPGVRFKDGGKEAILEVWRKGGLDALLSAEQAELPAPKKQRAKKGGE